MAQKCVALCEATVDLDLRFDMREGGLMRTSKIRTTDGRYECLCSDLSDDEIAAFGPFHERNQEAEIQLSQMGGGNILVRANVQLLCLKGNCESDGPSNDGHECEGRGTFPDTTHDLASAETQSPFGSVPTDWSGWGDGSQDYLDCWEKVKDKELNNLFAYKFGYMLKCLNKGKRTPLRKKVLKKFIGHFLAYWFRIGGVMNWTICPSVGSCGEKDTVDWNINI